MTAQAWIVEAEVSWGRDETLLYALAVGAGQDDPLRELQLTTEGTGDRTQQVLPTFASVLSQRVGRPPIAEYDRSKMLHVGEAVEVLAPIPAEGGVRGRARVSGIYDAGSNAIAIVETELLDREQGTALATVHSTLFVRGGSGRDGARPSDDDWQTGERDPDHQVVYEIAPNQALLYRLCGDKNPLHSDPRVAANAGFETPPIHGLCSHGFVARALINELCGGDCARFAAFEGRFTRPVFPGDRLDVAAWKTGAELLVQARTARGVVVDRGRFRAEAVVGSAR